MIICAKPWPGLSMQHNVSIFKKLGYKHVRYDPYSFIFKRKRSGTALEAFLRDLEKIRGAGMSIEEFHYYGSKDFDDFREKIQFYLELMKLAGVRHIVVHVSKEMMGHAGEMNEIIQEFKENKIHFCVENECPWEEHESYVLSLDILEDVLKKLPDAKVCLDVGHAFMLGIDPYEYWKRFKDKIKVIHLHDFAGGRDHQVPFTGKLLQSPLADELKSFKGPFVVELFLPVMELLEEKYGRAMEMLSRHLLK